MSDNRQNSNLHNNSGSNTITIPEVPSVIQLRASQQQPQSQPPRSGPRSQRPRVRWEEGVVDNEHMNKKKSKICCIFHPQQNFDDEHDCHDCPSDHGSSSSSSSSSSSESDNDKDMDFDARRKLRKERRHRKLQQKRSSSPNAYEVQPDYSHYREKQLNENSTS